jgi:hypothetical protein
VTTLGKTILASLIIDSCIEKTSTSTEIPISTAYFYCVEGDEKRNDATSIFLGLLTQLIARSLDVDECSNLLPYCHDRILGEMLPSFSTTETLFTCFCNTFPKLYLIIDGLDECQPDKRKQILTLVSKIMTICDNKEPGKVRILILSRDLLDIKTALGISTNLDLQRKDTVTDITNYVRYRQEMLHQKFDYLTVEDSTYIAKAVINNSESKCSDIGISFLNTDFTKVCFCLRNL